MSSHETTAALLTAAAELIAEVGWSAVSTRAIAERAGLPHGTVSYHFHGKADLLRQAAVRALDRAFSEEGWVAATEHAGVRDLVAGAGQAMRTAGGQDSRKQLALLSECLVQGSRDPQLRAALLSYLHRYRDTLVDQVSRDAADGRIRADVPPVAVATLVTAAVDGLMVHAALDPELDAEAACRALATLLAPGRQQQ